VNAILTGSMTGDEMRDLAKVDDPEAFFVRVEPHIAKMARVAARFGGSSERDDIVQEALLQAWRARHQYTHERGTLSSWLLAITAHEASRLRRRLSRRVAIASADRHEDLTTTVELREALSALTTRERLAIDCFYFAGLDIAETAAVMGCSEGTVKSTLASGRSRLRALLR
jgi:RNA polymerase sigma-70 factor (ECF subfamily)